MQSDYFDKKLKDAADNAQFSYDDRSWDNMEVLLDRHLPNKKRRWGLFLILIAVGLGGATSFVLGPVAKTSSQNSQTSLTLPGKTSVDTKNETTVTTELSEKTQSETKTSPSSIKTIDKVSELKTTQKVSISNNSKIEDQLKNSDSPTSTDQQIGNAKTSLIHTENSKPITSKRSKNTGTKQKTKSSVDLYNDLPFKDQANKNNSSNQQTVAAESPLENNKAAKTDVVDSVKKTSIAKKDDEDSTNIDETDAPKKIASSLKKGRVTIYPGIGPDLSGVNNNPAGKLRPRYGLGIGYNITGNLAVRTGFYVSRKVYSSDSAAYHPPKSFWNYYPNLKNVDANCLVYEIPLSLSYTVYRKNKNSIFVSPGISSYIMKKEKYISTYKNNWGTLQTHDLDFKDENKHWFSVLGISAGFTHQINKKISFTAEPYAQFPLSGVGFGKVKLKSTGLLLSVGIKPFAGKK